MNTDEILINYPALPDYSHSELRYRCQVLTPREERKRMISFMTVLVLVLVPLTVLIRLFGDWGLNPNAIAIFAAAGALIGAGIYVVQRRVKRAMTFALIAAGLPLMGALMSEMLLSRWVLFGTAIVAAAFLAWLANAVCNHYHAWRLADPKTPGVDQRLSSDCWTARVVPIFEESTPDFERRIQFIGPRAAALTSRYVQWRRSLLWFPAVCLTPGLILLGFAGPKFLTIPLVFVAFASILVVACVRARAAGLRWTAPLREAAEAVQSWLNYAFSTPDAPGLFMSPSGSFRRRKWFTALVLGFFCFTALPALDYMPSWITWMKTRDWIVVISGSMQTDTPGRALGAHILPRPEVPTGSDANDLNKRARDLNVSPSSLAQYEASESTPGAWIPTALYLAAMNAPTGSFSIATSIVLCVLFPPLVLYSVLVGMCSVSMMDPALHNPLATKPEEERYPLDTAWARYEDRVRGATTPERSHLWIGAHAQQDYPVLLEQGILKEHAYLTGDSGSGKTTLGLMSIVQQLIRRKEAAVVILDLKGDSSLFNTVREEAKRAGSTFKFFTNELGSHTHTFNPFLQADLSKLTLNQICETLLEALNLNHGEGYGRSYYSRVARRWLSSMLRQRPSIASFEELYEDSDSPENFRDEKERQDAFELVSVIESLASFQQINLTPTQADAPPDAVTEAIFMPHVIAQRQVVYFWLPAAVEAASVREIAKLAVYSLLRAAFLHNREGKKSAQTFLVIDEFQRIASSGFKVVLEQARSMGVGCILANQTPGDLATADVDLRPTINTNTRAKVCFSASDPAYQDELMRASGQTTYWLQSVAGPARPGTGDIVTLQEHFVPRVNRDDLLAIGDDPTMCLLQVGRGAGYTQFAGRPIPVKVEYTMPLARYLEMKDQPWPTDVPGTIQTTRRAIDPEEFHNAHQRLRAVQMLIDEFTASRRTVMPAAVPSSPVPARVPQPSVVETKPRPVPVGAGVAPSSGATVGLDHKSEPRPKPAPAVASPGTPPGSATSWHERLRHLQDQINSGSRPGTPAD